MESIKCFLICCVLVTHVDGPDGACRGVQNHSGGFGGHGSVVGVLTVRIPSNSTEKNIVICNASNAEVATWSPPNNIYPSQGYRNRMISCKSSTEPNGDRTVQMTMANPSDEDKGAYKCKDGGCLAASIDCNATYHTEAAGGGQGVRAELGAVLALCVVAILVPQLWA